MEAILLWKQKHLFYFSCVNDGYTEVLSFYKVLSKIIPHLTPDEVKSVIIRYSDNRGFNYRQMLFDMQEDVEQFPQKVFSYETGIQVNVI